MKYSWIGVFASFVLMACGSDGGSQAPVGGDDSKSRSEQPENDDDEKSESKSEPEKRVDPDDEEDYIRSNVSATGEYSVDSVRDNYKSIYNYKIRTGNIVWYSQKMTEKSYSVESVCYNEVNGKCDSYGRLYSAMDKHASGACPDGTNLPSAKDWEVFDAYRAKYSDIDKRMSLQYGGSCEKVKGKLECSGLDEVGNYLTSDGKIYSIRKGSSKSSILTANEFGFYNIRCVGVPSFVKTTKELPKCNSSLKNAPNAIYVFREKQNYRCYPERSEWLPDFTETCRDNGQKFVFNDTMMVCESGYWRLADVDEITESCTSDKQGKVLLFNGLKYACDDKSWRRFTSLEDSIGICNSRKAGTFDTLYAGNNMNLYYCNGSKWNEATIQTYMGDCKDSTSKFLNDTIDYKNSRYVCRGNGWVPYSNLEKRFGACIPQKLFMFENGSYDIENENTQYLCDSTGWITYSPDDIIGTCDSTMANWIAEFHEKYYRCNDYGKWVLYLTTPAVTVRDEMHKCIEKNANRIVDYYDNNGIRYVHICTQQNDTLYTTKGATFDECNKSNEGKDYTYESVKYYCNGAGYWQSYYSDLDKCTTKNYGKVSKSKEFGYVICDTKGWRVAFNYEYKQGLCKEDNNGTIVNTDDGKLICYLNEWHRLKEKSTFRVDGSGKEGK